MTETLAEYNITLAVAAPAPQTRAFTDAEIRTYAQSWFTVCYGLGYPATLDPHFIVDELCAAWARGSVTF